jgi:hypothetical protein
MNITKEQRDNLHELHSHKVALLEVCKQALSSIDTPNRRQHIDAIKAHNEEQLAEIEQYYKMVTGVSMERKTNIKGELLKGYEQIRGITGEVGAIKALHTVENVVIKKEKEISRNLPEDALRIVRNILSSDQKDYQYLDAEIKQA